MTKKTGDQSNPRILQQDNADHFDEKVCRKFLQIKTSADARGLEFNLNITSIRNLLRSKHCYFTKIELTWEPDRVNSLTIDRVDNGKGYIKGNVVACSASFNKIKNDLSVKQINQLYQGLKKHGDL